MTNAIVFDEKNRSAEISYKELLQTMEIGDNRGNLPKQCPVVPGALIQDICSRIKFHTGLEPIYKPIVIREMYCQTNRKKVKEQLPLDYEDYIIKRFVTKMTVPVTAFQKTPSEMNPSIAITYCFADDKKGIQVAFGENVSVCENLTVFGGFKFSTYGNQKVQFDEGMQLLDHWLQNFESMHRGHVRVCQDLMDANVTRKGFHGILGALFERAVRKNDGFNIMAPMGVGDCSAMVKAGGQVLEDRDHFSGWEILNWGTDVLKPHHSEMAGLIEDTARFGDFILEQLDIAPFKLDV